MAKLLDLKKINRTAFANTRSYEAALYAAKICNKIIEHSNSGHIVLHYENVVKPEFLIGMLNKHTFGWIDLLDQNDPNSITRLIGDEYNEFDKIICTKRDVREFFKLWRLVKVHYVTKAYDLI